MKRLLQFLVPYHIVNFILIISFPILRLVPLVCSRLFQPDASGGICQFNINELQESFIALISYYNQIIMFLALVVSIKSRRSDNTSQFLNRIYLFTKAANCILFYFHYFQYALVYAILCFVVFLVFPEPKYSGPEKVIYFRANGLCDELNRAPQNAWLVEFYTTWAPPCVQFAEPFAVVSNQYTLPNLKFGKIDVGRYPKIAEKYRIDVLPTSKQLPTVILFENGREVTRRPAVTSNNQILRISCKAESIINDFLLNELHAKYKKQLKPKQLPVENHQEKKNV